jgi:small-conductance mechanosensitive channel
MKRTKMGAVAVIILAFVFGIIAGYAATTIVKGTHTHKSGRPEFRNVSEYVKQRLQLSEEQVVLYDEIIRTRREIMNKHNKEYKERIDNQIDSLRTEIKSVLSADQLVEYEKFLDEFKEYREKRRKR